MRTITQIDVGLESLRLKKLAEADDAARELVEILLAEERFIWPEHEPLSPREILDAYDAFVATYGAGGETPTDPDGTAIVGFVREFLDVDPDGSERGYDLDRETLLRFDAMRHAISILVQIPSDERDQIPSVQRVIEDRQARVFGLMFQSDNRFTFRLRYHTPESLKAATERLVNAVAPRNPEELHVLIEALPTRFVAGVHQGLQVSFPRPVEMKTPAGELAREGTVHVVGAGRGLAAYVGWRSPQRALLILAGILLLADLVFQIFAPSLRIGNLDLSEWVGGTLGRLTTAAFTAYLFAGLLEYIRLRGRFRRASAAFIDWGSPQESDS